MAWERKRGPFLVIGMLHREVVDTNMIYSALSLERPGWNTLVLFESGRPYDVARNNVATRALDVGAEWCFYWDSTPGYTPVIVRDPVSKRIDVKPISELGYFGGSGLERIACSWEAYTSKDKWTKIRYLLRYPFRGKLRRIITAGGAVDLSLSHSIFTKTRGAVEVSTLREGQYVSIPRSYRGTNRRGSFFLGREDLAWLYGFFLADGSASRDSSNVGFCNKKEALIDKAKELFEDYFNRPLCLIEDGGLLHARSSHTGIARFFRERFYTGMGEKRVPLGILNAPTGIKTEFLRGYHAGDGHSSKTNQEFQEFACGSQIEAEGIRCLLKDVGLSSFVIRVREDKKSYEIIANSGLYEREARGVIKKIVDFEYEGFLYDIETEDHTFCGGLGGFYLHNSDMVIPPNTLTRLTSHELMIVGGLYDRRHPEIWPEIFRDAGGGVLDPIPRSQIPEPSALPQGLMEVDGIGAGCLLVHRRVFEVLKEKVPLRTFSVRGPPPGEIKFYEFFRWGVGRDPGSEGPSYSEDLTFSVLARKHGFKIFCDTFVKPMHLAPMAIKDGKVTWTPLEGGGT